MTCRSCDADFRQFYHKWTVEKPSATASAGGHIDEDDDDNWAFFGKFGFKVHTENSREFYRALQVKSDITHVFDVRYSQKTSQIGTHMRLTKGSRVLKIVGAYNVDEANQVMRLRLVERI